MRPFLVLLLVLAAAGAYFLAVQTDPSSSSGAASPGESGTPVVSAPDPKPSDAELASPTAAPRDPGRAPTPPANATSAAPAPKGTAVYGTVETADGAPVANAKITLTRFGANGLFFVDPQEMNRDLDRSTQSAANGAFAFDEVEPYEGYSVIVNHPDYASLEEGPLKIGEGLQTELVLRLKPGVRLYGQVIDEGGNSVRGASIQLGLSAMGLLGMGGDVDVENDPYLRTTTSDANGNYEFKNVGANTFSITCAAEGYGKITLQAVPITGDGDVEQNLTLRAASMIAGRILDAATNLPIVGATINVYSLSGNRDTRTSTSVQSAEEGAFLIQDVNDGEYQVRAEAPGYHPKQERVSAGDMSAEVRLTAQPRIKGRVVDGTNGSPVKAFTIVQRMVIQNSNESMRDTTTMREIKHDGGEFDMPAAQVGKYIIEAFAPGFAPSFSQPFDVTTGQDVLGVEVRLNTGGTIRGRVVDEKGTPVEGALIASHGNDWVDDLFMRSLPAPPGSATLKKTRSGKDGRFSLDGLSPTLYQIHVDHKDYTKTVLKNVSVILNTVTEAGDFVISEGSTISGMVRSPNGQPLSGATVTLVLQANANTYPIQMEAKTNRDGRYSIAHVRAGTYDISAARPAQGTDGMFAGALDHKNTRRPLSVTGNNEYPHIDFDLSN